MRFRQFAIWNFLASAAFVLAVGPTAYGAGEVSTGDHDPVSLGMLIGGIAVIAVGVVLARRDYLRHKTRRSSVGRPVEPPDRAIQEHL